MNYLNFELLKLKARKWVWLLASGTSLLLPLVIKTLTNLSYLDKQVTEGQFMEQAAYGFITYSAFYIFLPVWIIVFIGTEFGNGHTNQVVFNTSTKDYFTSKLIYCLLISLAFSLLGIITMVLVQVTAPFEIMVTIEFYLLFIFQSFFTFFSTAILFMAITFLARNIVIAFVSYFLLSFTEGMIFLFVKKMFNIELFFLPFHITNILYVKGGEKVTENYYNIFQEPDSRALVLPLFLLLILSLTYWDFTKRELKPLSD